MEKLRSTFRINQHRHPRPGGERALVSTTWRGKIRAVLISLILWPGITMAGVPEDSTARGELDINPRLNSAGYFPYTGAVLNHHINADVNFFYQKRHFGGFVFKSQDLVDPRTYINYLQPGIFVNVHAGHLLRGRVVAGYIFNQTTHFRDYDSDVYAAGVLYWQISEHLRIENTALFFDCTIENKLANRLLMSWKQRRARVDAYLWHRQVFRTGEHSDSFSAAVTFPIIAMSKTTNLELTTSWITYLTNDRPGYALKQGFVFTLAVPMQFDHL